MNHNLHKETNDFQQYLPAGIPSFRIGKFKENWNKATNGKGNLMLFAGDQKVEHMNADFLGEGIAPDDANPRHLFDIASQAQIGVFATQMGLISRYGRQYPKIPYLVKLNSKTNLVPFAQQDPLSKAWFDVEEVVSFAKVSKLNIVAVGYTLYLGSDFEAQMLQEAARIVHEAHVFGLLAVLWIYPKGKVIKDEHDVKMIAGAAGVGACLGADFVKIKVPYENGVFSPDLLKEVVNAAGNTGVLCEGGAKTNEQDFLTELFSQIHESGTRGSGTGRNIHQRALKEAIKMANAIFAVTVENKTVEEAMAFLN